MLSVDSIIDKSIKDTVNANYLSDIPTLKVDTAGSLTALDYHTVQQLSTIVYGNQPSV